MNADAERRCGFVALLGAPNVGKSTLINALVGAKVAIVSPLPQTTRLRVAAVAMRDATQIVLLDLPGIFRPRKRLDRAMVDAAWRAIDDVDRILVAVDAKRGFGDEPRMILERVVAQGRQADVVVSKIDLVTRAELLPLIGTFRNEKAIDRVFLVSARKGEGVDDLRRHLAEAMPVGPWHFAEDDLMDIQERLFAAEITREQIFLQLRQELPYACAVETTSWTERDDGSVRIEQTIHVERDGQRRIVIGAKGAQLKAIGSAARRAIGEALGRPAHLLLHVKASAWGEQRDLYRAWGLDYDAS